MYNNIYNKLLYISIPENSFIAPGGHMGQLVYCISKPNKILGFLDNDISKHYKRNYGTPYFIYPFDKIKDYNSLINIYIYAGPYLNEIIKQLEEYNNINIIIL